MSTKNPCTPRKTSQTAQILEHVEKLLALHESPGIDDNDDGQPFIPASSDLDELLSEYSKNLVDSFDSIVQQYHEKTVEIIRATSALIDKRFELFDSRLAEVTDAFESGSESLESGSESFESGSESLVSGSASLESDRPGDRPTSVDSNDLFVQPTVSTSDDSASHWDKQKAAMLAKYGIDPDYRPVMEPPASARPEVVTETPTNQLDEMQRSIDTMAPADAEAVEAIKRELTSKLRDAEVELSINRAKIIQQTAEMEKRKADLDRRASELEQKFSAQSSGDQRAGILDRFKRHLPSRGNSSD